MNGGSAADGTQVQMWNCGSNAAAQTWTMASDGTVSINGKCLDITGGAAANGALVNPASGKCLDDPGFNTAQGTQLDLWTCNGGSDQQWSVP